VHFGDGERDATAANVEGPSAKFAAARLSFGFAQERLAKAASPT